MTDLQEQLRDWNPAMQPVPPEILLKEAADALDEKDRRIEELEKQVDYWYQVADVGEARALAALEDSDE